MSERRKEPTEEVFLKDVSQHEMTVLLDNGIYRHLRFKQPKSSNAWFEIVTWPGRLAYTGDMGSFVFSRLTDMFEFFRTDRRDDGLGINLGYWGEKLQAVDRDGRTSSHRRFSADRFRENVEEVVKDWIENFQAPYDSDEEEESEARKAFEEELREAIQNDVYDQFDDNEHEAYKAVNDFSFDPDPKRRGFGPRTYQFSDTWEWNCEDYTYRFIWCCYAIAWSIKQYDSRESKDIAA